MQDKGKGKLMDLNLKNCRMTTFTGKWINPFYMTPDDLEIRDIAHHLSNICRYNGATNKFYSVAEHSLLIARQLSHYNQPANYVMTGLMHDACEAYLGDIITPIKGFIPDFKHLENQLQAMIYDWCGCGMDYNALMAVSDLDERIQVNEALLLFNKIPKQWNFKTAGVPLFTPIKCLSPDKVERDFINYFDHLKIEVDNNKIAAGIA